MALGGILNIFGAGKQEDAQKQASEDMRQNIDDTKWQLGGLRSQGLQELAFGRQAANNAIQNATAGGINAINQGTSGALSSLDMGRSDIMGARDAALDTSGAGFNAARGALDPLLGLQGMSQGATQAVSTRDVTGTPSALSGLLAQDPMSAAIEADPAYQFRQQQGEQAIDRAASAAGGRLSGRTLKELAGFNSNLASQEANNIQNRRLAAHGQNMNAAANVDSMASQLSRDQAARELQAGLAAQGNQAGLASLGYNAQGTLSDIFNQQGQFGAGLYTGAGQGLSGLASQGANVFQQGGQSTANLFEGAGRNLANVETSLAQAGANLNSRLGDQFAGLAGAENSAIGRAADAEGMQMAAGANFANDLTNLALSGAAMASDPRLKTDIEPVKSRYESIGLQGYRWKWRDEASGLGLNGSAQGVMATDVYDKYPEAVGLRDGYLTVDYGKLNELAGAA